MSNWNDFIQPNLGWLYNKRIYLEKNVVANTDKANLDNYYNDLINFQIGDFANKLNSSVILSETPGFNNFYLQITYPGLIIGTGYAHGIDNKEDFKLGFFFDHTTGLPVIPGSTIKGIIRSFFEADIVFTNDKQKETTQSLSVSQVNDLLSKYCKKDIQLTIDDVVGLKERIFGTSEKNGQSGKDIFLDAVIDPTNSTANSAVLGKDYITPHKHANDHKLDTYTDPTPIRFIKVMPGVVFEFRFILEDAQTIKELTADIKKKMFEEIILLVGIGAKTSTGYGYMIQKKSARKVAFENSFPEKAIQHFIKGKSFEGIICDMASDYYLTRFTVHGNECYLSKKLKKEESFKVGDAVEVLCNGDFTTSNPNMKVKLRK